MAAPAPGKVARESRATPESQATPESLATPESQATRRSQPESALSAPVKALLEAQGYDVKGEIRGCDLVGVRGDDPPVIVELKRTFSLALVHQGIDRLAMTDAVYLAVGAWPTRPAEVRRLCRRLGLGLIVVTAGRADVLEDPTPYRPRRDARRAGRLLREHQRRVGDPMPGGSTRVPVMTAYRQQALRCARLLDDGPLTPRELRARADVPNAGPILRDDVYGWFERIARGTYALTPQGRGALEADRALDPGGARDG